MLCGEGKCSFSKGGDQDMASPEIRSSDWTRGKSFSLIRKPWQWQSLKNNHNKETQRDWGVLHSKKIVVLSFVFVCVVLKTLIVTQKHLNDPMLHKLLPLQKYSDISDYLLMNIQHEENQLWTVVIENIRQVFYLKIYLFAEKIWEL